MNYDHAFHAGNPADVIKHAALVLVLRELVRRQEPICYVDTHAGQGWYRLEDKTGEWTQGIAKITSGSARRRLPELLPYLDLVCPEGEKLDSYPGSPALAQAVLREQDRLCLFELNPRDFRELSASLGAKKDRRLTLEQADGYPGLLRTKQEADERLLVLIDPPFEEVDEWDRIDQAVKKIATKRPGAVLLLWYPIKSGPPHEGRPEALRRSLLAAKTKGLAIDFLPQGGLLEPRTNVPKVRASLAGTGLILIGAPSRAVAKLSAALPELGRSLARAKDDLAYQLQIVGWG